MKIQRTRLITRCITLLLAVLFASQALPWMRMPPSGQEPAGTLLQKLPVSDLAVILPAMSPFLAVCSAIAARTLSLLFLICLPVVLLSLFAGRKFCLYMCPTGFLAELAGKIRGKKRPSLKKIPHLGPLLLTFAIAGAFLGYPIFLWMDPLSIFNGFISVWRKPVAAASLVPAIGFVTIILLSLWRPNLWCYRLCPLGFSQEVLRSLALFAKERRTKRAFAARYWAGRRLALVSLAGIVLSFIARKVSMSSRVIRPPGICKEDQLGALCARCGNCVRVCPEKIIHHDLGESGVERLLTPVITIGSRRYCREDCNECNKVCPTGAIERLSLAEKTNVAIGIAKIIEPRCIPWAFGRPCFVCARFCPYLAIKMTRQQHVRAPCPEVDAEICRGCGLCQLVCPARDTAIIVKSVEQRLLEPVELAQIPRDMIEKHFESLARMRGVNLSGQ